MKINHVHHGNMKSLEKENWEEAQDGSMVDGFTLTAQVLKSSGIPALSVTTFVIIVNNLFSFFGLIILPLAKWE